MPGAMSFASRPWEGGTATSSASGSAPRLATPRVETSVERWKQASSEGKGPNFVLQLADLIDGYSFDDKDQDKNLTRALAPFKTLPPEVVTHHLAGNHELMCFRPDELLEHGFGREGKMYYSFKPHKGWRVIVLDSLGVSTVRPGCTKFKAPPEGDEKYAEAREMLMKGNPNLAGGEATWYSGIDWTKGLTGDQARFMPYNGALGHTQRDWLQQELAAAKAEGEKVLVATHVPIHHSAAAVNDLMFDQDQVLKELKEAGNVVAFLAGHCHSGGYTEEDGTTHVTFMSSLELDPEVHKECGATVSVFPDRIEIEGHGAQSSYSIKLQ
eukprot:Hpha_TRINITY_DN932_c0_g1::TRINITY_DN932_c0_g1_i2::g.156288::m.156288/K01517/ADPRM; manganese-dependent ADP-ribose/CDP-alcohol diphosphatase